MAYYWGDSGHRCRRFLVGDYCKVLNPIGVGYVMLLQAPIYPLLVSTLIHGL